MVAGNTIKELKCEYRIDPQGIDIIRPRLSWILESNERGQTQTAYQILVSENREDLLHGKGELWDSGKVISSQSVNVIYSGVDLQSRQRCYWKVRSWDKNDTASPWSKIASWSMGLLSASDWKAKWIGLDAGGNQDYFSEANWIWLPDENSVPAVKRYFRCEIHIPEDAELYGARLTIATSSLFSIWVNGKKIKNGAKTIFAPSFETDLEKYLLSGSNVIGIEADGNEKEDEPSGLICTISAELNSGETLLITSGANWKTSACCSDIGYDDSSWIPACELGINGKAPFKKVLGNDFKRLPARMLRKDFFAGKGVKRATAYMCGLGLSELYINGCKIGDSVLSPGLTDYNKRALYITRDVTADIKPGDNAVGVTLGNGRYYSMRENTPTDTVSFGYPKLILQIETEYNDGSVDAIVSDDSWKITSDGPIRGNSEYDGEIYDARLEMDGWNEYGFPASGWRQAELVEPPKGILSSEMAEPIKVVETLHPLSMKNTAPGTYVFDMGQNMAGWCRLKVEGSRGTRVYIRYAEKIDSDGNLVTDNLRSAKAVDSYILDGNGLEVYEPRYTYHGFRYVELTGFPGEPNLLSVEGRVICDSLSRSGDFSCADSLVNKIYHNIYWSVRGNYRSIPTDCPQRDERQGWFGDRCQVSRGEMYLFDTAAMHTKWLRDIEDSQREDGSLPDLAPAYWAIYSGSITFPVTFVAIAGHLYDLYGDTRIIETHYPAMKKWVESISLKMKDFLMPDDTYGDWCVPPESLDIIWSEDPERVTDRSLVSTAYFYKTLNLLSGYANILGKSEDAAEFSDLAAKVKAAFNGKYFNNDGNFYGNNNTQSSGILTLAFGLVNEEQKQAVVENLVSNILVKNECHIGAGMMGAQWMMRALSDNDRSDIACKLLFQTTYPGWGYMLGAGATTFWELWNGDKGDPLMNSGNHVMQIGDLCIWLYEYVAGIAPDKSKPGFKHIIMNPIALEEFSSAKASHKSMYGNITSEWKIVKSSFEWEICIPVNTSATVYLPAKNPECVAESGNSLADVEGVRFVEMSGDRCVLELGSGCYSFVSEF